MEPCIHAVQPQGRRQPRGLPAKVIDTGMGFERLVRTLQGKTSNYDTDVFQPILKAIGDMTGATYGKNEQQDIAMRVIADHIRTIAFSITDGQLPSNAKAGYVSAYPPPCSALRLHVPRTEAGFHVQAVARTHREHGRRIPRVECHRKN
mgnify:CR=1 FL=1